MGSSRKKLLAIMLALLVLGIVPALIKAAPDKIVLDDLSSLYGPVQFDHSLHTMFGSCASCHHHTLGGEAEDPRCVRCHRGGEPADAIACRDCHSAERFSSAYLEKIENDPHLYHTGRPGLMGAFHQSCLGCHQRMGVAAECTDCHAMTEKGNTFYRSDDIVPKSDLTEK